MMWKQDFYPDLRRRRADGLVAHILHILESRRIEAMLGTTPPMIVRKDFP